MIHFYVFHKEALMLISDLPKEKIKVKYGPIFEIVNSVKDKDSLDLIKPRIIRQYPKLSIVEDFYVRKVFSEETREKLRQKKLGRPRADWVREKISSKMKGKSNFEGKEHNVVSRKKTSLSMQGKQNTKGKFYIYNPYTDHETMIDKGSPIPEGYRLGRDPENIGGFMSSLS